MGFVESLGPQWSLCAFSELHLTLCSLKKWKRRQTDRNCLQSIRFFRHIRTWPAIRTVQRIATVFRLVQQQGTVLTGQAMRRQYIEELLNGLLASEGQRGQFEDKQDEREWGAFYSESSQV